MFINYFSPFFLNVDEIFHIVCGRIFAFVFVKTENRGKRSEYYEFNSINIFIGVECDVKLLVKLINET